MLIAPPAETPSGTSSTVQSVLNGDFEAVLTGELAQKVLKKAASAPSEAWGEVLRQAISENAEGNAFEFLGIVIAALHAFIQSNVTGPPLRFRPANVLLPDVHEKEKEISKRQLLQLSVDGEAAYHLTPNILLFVLAKEVASNEKVADAAKDMETWIWWRQRVNFLHQKILSEPTGTLQGSITADLNTLKKAAPWAKIEDEYLRKDIEARYYIESALVDTYFGLDRSATKNLEAATKATGFEFALTGILGKRTRYQEKDLSQLVVLAKSSLGAGVTEDGEDARESAKPKTLDLNDDTLLESIAFKSPDEFTADVRENVPESLKSLDPSKQPLLHPLDSAILLLLTETIKNTNPASGITREEMIPYAERVLQHSNNWEVYTRGLLVRSRIEGYKSRTAERSLLQLQALVDQIIAETTTTVSSDPAGDHEEKKPTTFLPKPEVDEEASAQERLRYIFQLPIPTRWDLERELAERWVSLGGLRTALEIYERLELWAEAALCWAATEREDKAREIIENQLYEPKEESSTERKEKVPPPANAPRLWCILGDIGDDPAQYEKAWEVSGRRYARAKRSLGRYYLSNKEHALAAEAYRASLAINALNEPAWFSLGCCYLELEKYDDAVEAFGRCVGIADDNAEAWANLATALLRRDPSTGDPTPQVQALLDDEEENEMAVDHPEKSPEYNKLNALKALKRAASIKYDNWRIWENLLIVAASTKPTSYGDVVLAMKRIIEIRGPSEGERCIDVDILEMLVRHVIMLDAESENPGYDPKKPGLARNVVEFVEKIVVPLITANRRLWLIVGRLAQWRKRPASALDAYEKAYRVTVTQFEVKHDDEGRWKELVEACEELVDAYETYGPQETTEGLAADSGTPVAKDWKFKARSACRSVMSKGKAHGWEDSEGYERLREVLDGLKA